MGNYVEVLSKILPNPIQTQAFTAPSENIALDILKDLPRQNFFPSKARTFVDHVATWLAPTVSKSYTQGNMTASFITHVIFKNFILDPKFMSGHDWAEYIQKYGSFSLAYYDDQGIPCGVSITFSELDPTLWAAAIIRNTTAEPENRHVLVISPPDLLDLELQNLEQKKKAVSDFEEFIGNTQIQKLIKGQVFLSNGAVNVTHLTKLCKRHPWRVTEEEMALLGLYLKQETELRGWKLNAAQFDYLKVRLEEKRLENTSEITRALTNKHRGYSPDLENTQLDALSTRSFYARNKTELHSALGTLFFAGSLVPLGFVFSAMGIGCLALAGAFFMGCGLSIASREMRLSSYLQKKATFDNDMNNRLEKRREEIGTNINITNDQEQITRAVLAANFSKAEFEELKENISTLGVYPKPYCLSPTEESKPITSESVAHALSHKQDNSNEFSVTNNQFTMWVTQERLDSDIKDVESTHTGKHLTIEYKDKTDPILSTTPKF